MPRPQLLFLFDGIGALVSSLFLGIILVSLESHIGMPSRILYSLAGIALVFALYSILCYLLFPENWSSFLKLIAMANSMYAMLTIGLIIYYFRQLTLLGLSYFVLEILVLIFLIRLEFRVVSEKK